MLTPKHKKRIIKGLLLTGLTLFFVLQEHTWTGIILTTVFGLCSLVLIAKLVFPHAKWLHRIAPPVYEPDDRPFEEIYNDPGIFVYTADGFIITIEQATHRVKWTEVQTIFGYKRDLFSIDTICVDVFCDNDISFSIREETTGWHVFTRQCKEHLTGINPMWDIEITTPAFETKLTLVYDRQGCTFTEAQKAVYGSSV